MLKQPTESLPTPENQRAAICVEARARIQLRHGPFESMVFRHSSEPSLDHVALVMGDVSGDDCLLRVHSECLTGEAFGSLHCDCGEQLDQALARIARTGRGLVTYLRQEGRGIGLVDKIRAYSLQARGLDTFEANRALGFPDDARRYDAAAAILAKLGVQSVELLTNNPDKVQKLGALGVNVRRRVSMPVSVNPHNARYLAAKNARLQALASRSSANEDALPASLGGGSQ